MLMMMMMMLMVKMVMMVVVVPQQCVQGMMCVGIQYATLQYVSKGGHL